MPRKTTRIDGDGNVSWATPDGDTVRVEAAVDIDRAHLMNSEVISVQVGCDDHGTRHEGALSEEVLNATFVYFSLAATRCQSALTAGRGSPACL